MHIVELEEIYKNYGKLEVLKNINLQIEKGTSTALVGPTGSGKTVMLRLIDLLENHLLELCILKVLMPMNPIIPGWR